MSRKCWRISASSPISLQPNCIQNIQTLIRLVICRYDGIMTIFGSVLQNSFNNIKYFFKSKVSVKNFDFCMMDPNIIYISGWKVIVASQSLYRYKHGRSNRLREWYSKFIAPQLASRILGALHILIVCHYRPKS